MFDLVNYEHRYTKLENLCRYWGPLIEDYLLKKLLPSKYAFIYFDKHTLYAIKSTAFFNEDIN